MKKAKPQIKPRKIYGLDVAVFTSKDGKRKYLVFKTPKDNYHVFLEVDAAKAARDCGAKKGWHELWQLHQKQ